MADFFNRIGQKQPLEANRIWLHTALMWRCSPCNTVQSVSAYALNLLASCSSCFHKGMKNCALFATHFLSVLMELPMGIMDTLQENNLEKSLGLAAEEPALRPDFFKTLLNSTIYVLGTASTGDVFWCTGELNEI
ncbi:hypothetical protein P5706_34605 [Pseudomonas sp. ChxA]|uniref:hypothetical protein n=1 Tax=Pseudomonas sp. ChxA TaxID=3035473 RepID=UPI0025550BB3|nr:hypothetical protein [Pseudomonas sp. ChxA]MDL2189303.1 hypothetical protein [Pseudomonas sp. ChxA]